MPLLSRNQTKMPSLVTYPDALSQIICPMSKDGTIERMTGEITGEERKAPEGTWVLGGGIELPCSHFIYGKRKTT